MSLRSETESTKSETAPDAPSSSEAPPRKRGGCFRVFFLLVLIGLPIFAFLLNGPVARWGIGYAIDHFGGQQGIHGSVSVEGSLLSGFALSEGQFSGDEGAPIDSLSFEKLGVDYDPWHWIREGGLSGLRELEVHGVSAHVVLPHPADAESPEDPPAGEESSPNGLDEKLLEELLAIRYSFRDLDLTLETSPGEVYEVVDFDLVLEPGGDGLLSLERVAVPGQPPWENVETPIQLTPDSVSLGPLPLFESVEIQSLHAQFPRPDEPIATARVLAYGAAFDARYGEGQEITLSLSAGALPVSEVLRWFPVEGLEVGDLSRLQVHFEGDFLSPKSWSANVDLAVSEASWEDYRARSLELSTQLNPSPGAGESAILNLEGDGVRLEAKADFSLEGLDDVESLSELPARIDAIVEVLSAEEAIAGFVPDLAPQLPLTGEVEAAISASIVGPKPQTGTARILSRTLNYDSVPIDQIQIDAHLDDGQPLRFEANLALDPSNLLKASGSFDLETRAYSAQTGASVRFGERLATLLSRFDHETAYSGAVDLTWNGSGDLLTPTHRGTIDLQAQEFQIGEAEAFHTEFTGNYEDLDIELTRLSLRAMDFQVDGLLSWKQEILDIPHLTIRSDELLLLEGEIHAPLAKTVFEDPMQFFAQTGEVKIDVHSHDLALDSLLSLVQQSPPVVCTLGLDLQASGTPASLQLDAELRAEGIAAQKGLHAILDEQVRPANARLQFQVRDAVAHLEGLVEQPQIEPFHLQGSLPFHPSQWLDGSRDLLDETVALTATMAPSSLAFLPPMVPAVKEISGTLGIDLAVEGPLRSPEIAGSTELEIPSLHFASESAPAMRDFQASLRFEDKAVHVDQLQGILAGGQIGMKGKVGLEDMSDPAFDLRLGGHEVLVFRSDSVSARTDLNLSLQGPLSQAHLAGVIGITNSLFYKDFDLLPVNGIPGRGEESAIPEVDPGPRMPAPESLEVGVPMAPLKDWTLDVELATLDPFRVAGNLAQAEIESALRVSGTLGTPVPNGRIWIESGRLVLPFSKIDLSDAEIRFDESTGFNGILGMRARSKVGDYWVNIFVQNRLLSPEIVFSSVPPLPREDILTLLGSGATRDQLSDGGGTAATKAAIYYFKSLTNKEGRIDPDAPPSFADTIEERTSVRIGQTNPDTGEKEIDATIRLWKQSYLGFSFGQEGSYRGVLKYLFRFP